MISIMDELGKYMANTDEAISDLQARLKAVEKVLTQMQGVTMQSDPSRLPTVVYEGTSDAHN